MTQSSNRLQAGLYWLFALSGFAGLIYESIWSHYLKLFLGHAAYAQTLVLVIFMGGMALGAWWCADLSRRLPRPLMAYAAVEAVLGILAMLFDPLFRGMQGWVFDHAIPALDSPSAIDLLKWGLSALLILPQCALLGATFPLMSAGVVRLFPANPGRALGWLYFTNSLGAAVGVLLSGFVLIDAVGLPGTILVAGFVNFALASVVWLLARTSMPSMDTAPAAVERPAPGLTTLMLAAAFLTGAASFFYEIGWIRMLSLVLGAATHSFELMLSAFILGLALGSFYIRNRIEDFTDPLPALGWIQIVMGALALGTLALYGQSFDWMSFILRSLQRNDAGYLFFNLYSHGVCLALMLPVTFWAGMTLPLITGVLLRAGFGEASIGRVYAANTLGAIAGVLLAVHLVMPLLGLKQVIVLGGVVDLALGLWLMARSTAPLRRRDRAALAAALLAAVAVIGWVRLDPSQLASGVFRHGAARSEGEVLFHRDGKTASVDVLRNADSGTLSLLTNGKVDAGLNPKVATPDEYTMVLSAALPMMLNPAAAEVAVIGMGSGRTTHAFLQNPALTRVDTVEIEPGVVEGARLFGDAVSSAFDDARSQIYIEDAKTFFARHQARYDLIMSEPSNPWVSGVASLFSAEFYVQIGRYLKPGGLLVQWLQLYEFDLGLFASVLEALGPQFKDYVIYATNNGDVLIVASPEGAVPAPDSAAFERAGLKPLLEFIDVQTLRDIELRRIGGKRELAGLIARWQSPPNSDYYPYVDQHAVKRRFLQAAATPLVDLGALNRRLAPPPSADARATPSMHYPPQELAAQAQVVADYFAWQRGRRGPPTGTVDNSVLSQIVTLRALHDQCDGTTLQAVWVPAMRRFSELLLADLSEEAVRDIAADLRGARCFRRAPEAVRHWLAFFEAAGLHRDAEVRSEGQALIDAARKAGADLPMVVVQEMLLADLRLKDAPAVLARLKNYGKQIPDTLGIRYLESLAQAAGGQ
jgi:predicted membrane-bound spermidine synthase